MGIENMPNDVSKEMQVPEKPKNWEHAWMNIDYTMIQPTLVKQITCFYTSLFQIKYLPPASLAIALLTSEHFTIIAKYWKVLWTLVDPKYRQE